MPKSQTQKEKEQTTVRRKIFGRVYCEFIYPDDPVSECDCNVGRMHGPHRFIKGIAEYPKPNEKENFLSK